MEGEDDLLVEQTARVLSGSRPCSEKSLSDAEIEDLIDKGKKSQLQLQETPRKVRKIEYCKRCPKLD